jgi:signal transduction histidine kinase
MARHRTLITYLAALFFAISNGLRLRETYDGVPIPGTTKLLFTVFFLLLALEPWLSRRSKRLSHLYLAVQTALAGIMLYIPPHPDYVANVLTVLTIQAFFVFPPRIAVRWAGIFTLTMAVMMIYSFGWGRGFAFIPVYVIAFAILGSFVAMMGQLEASQVELEKAHRQLQRYTRQAEELARIQERNRLARDLHDSVTQMIFSITLITRSTLILLDRSPDQVRPKLEQLQELAQNALGEMRALISQLRPLQIGEEGLFAVLERHVEELNKRGRSQLAITLTSGEEALPLDENQQQELFRIIQEALNNVVKHSGATKASVGFEVGEGAVTVVIKDDGIGFDPAARGDDRAHFGLESMAERAEEMNGSVAIETKSGRGTEVRISIPAGEERMAHG